MSDERAGSADGRGDGHADGLGDDDLIEKDRAYSPASERETEAAQRDTDDAAEALPPGTGGPDDPGDLPPGEPLDVSIVQERSDPE